MSLIHHAEAELKRAGLFDKDSDYEGGLGEAVMALVKVFAEQGHSGFSAKRTLQIFNKVADYGILMPLTGEDDEWMDTSEMSGKEAGSVFQNKRIGALFKEGKDGKPYYLDAITWRTENGSTWNGSAFLKGGCEHKECRCADIRVSSRQFIKGFPFTPKTFVIDVVEQEVSKDNWEFDIKDPKQLDEVYEYYARPENIPESLKRRAGLQA